MRKGMKTASFHPSPIKFTKMATHSKRSGDKFHRSKSKLDMGHFAPSKAKRPAFLWGPIGSYKYHHHHYHGYLHPYNHHKPSTYFLLQNVQEMRTTLCLLCSISPTPFTPGIILEWWGLEWWQAESVRRGEEIAKADRRGEE